MQPKISRRGLGLVLENSGLTAATRFVLHHSLRRYRDTDEVHAQAESSVATRFRDR